MGPPMTMQDTANLRNRVQRPEIEEVSARTPVKPLLRGVSHQISFFVAIVATAVLVGRAQTRAGSVGALVYALKRPDPFPRVFGYHEIFHLLVVLASVFLFAHVTLAIRAVQG